MKKIFTIFIVISVAFSSVCFALSSKYQAKGKLTLDENTINLKTAIAIWKPELNDLMIELLPTELDNKEIKKIQKENGVKPWLEWSSLHRVTLHIFIKNPEEKITISNISRFTLIHDGPNPKEYLAITFYSPQKPDAKIIQINGILKKSSNIRIITEGDTSLGKHKMNWYIEMDSIIHEKVRN